jgi:hypothetical protein
MSWLTEWKAISAQIEGLVDAARFYVESSGPAQKDIYSVGNRQLIPQILNIFEALRKFADIHKGSIPPAAAQSLVALFNKVDEQFPHRKEIDAYIHVHIRVTILISFRSEFEYHISDTEAVAKRLSERAFAHLKRSIVADKEVRNKWIEAFKENELACEKLGGVHLLLHGIWAFKLNAEGERTDLVFQEPLPDSSDIERSAESLVLTEWKLIKNKNHNRPWIPKPAEIQETANAARRQIARYASGALGGLELARYRFIVLVSLHNMVVPADLIEDGITYRHINIPVDPEHPSKTVRENPTVKDGNRTSQGSKE